MEVFSRSTAPLFSNQPVNHMLLICSYTPAFVALISVKPEADHMHFPPEGMTKTHSPKTPFCCHIVHAFKTKI
jgi:hypothetical protein